MLLFEELLDDDFLVFLLLPLASSLFAERMVGVEPRPCSNKKLRFVVNRRSKLAEDVLNFSCVASKDRAYQYKETQYASLLKATTAS